MIIKILLFLAKVAVAIIISYLIWLLLNDLWYNHSDKMPEWLQKFLDWLSDIVYTLLVVALPIYLSFYVIF